MEQAGGVIIQVLYTVEDFLWMWGILRMPLTKDKRKLLGAGTSFAAFLLLEGIWGLGENADVILLMVRCVLAVIIFSNKVAEIIVKFWFSVFYMNIVEEPVEMILHLTIQTHQSDAIFVLWKTIDVIFVLMLAVAILQKYGDWIQEISLKAYLTGLGLAFCAAGMGAFTRMAAETMTVGEAFFYQGISLVLEEFIYFMGILLAYINVLKKRYQRENREKDELLAKTKQHYDAQRQYMQEIRKIRHDMNAHLQMLRACLNDAKENRAREYLDQMLGRSDFTKIKDIDVGNDLINAVIEGELLRSEDLQLHCVGKLPLDTSVNDYDLCVIFSNLLSNAREACEKLEKSNKVIEVRIRQMKQHFVLEVENPVEWEIQMDDVITGTTKEDKDRHGYGMRNVREAVEKYGGTVEFPKKAGAFVVSVCL